MSLTQGQIDSLYTEEWYRQHLPFRDEFHRMADIIVEAKRADEQWLWSLDVGCGPGFISEWLHNHYGLGIRAVDASGAARAYMPECVSRQFFVVDATSPAALIPNPGSFDLVICTEVAEHLMPEDSDALVSYLDTAARKAIFWSAAPPGQGGHGHFNEQPESYWLDKFATRGWGKAPETKVIREKLREQVTGMHFFAKTAMLLRRV